MDTRGKALACVSLAMILLLVACAIGVMAYGAWVWRTIPNPDPFGFTSGLFFTATMLLLVSSVAAVFILLSFIGDYRAAWTAPERVAISRRWTGTLFLLGGIPFFGLSLVLFGPTGQILWLGSVVAFVTGAGYLVHAHLSSGGIRA